MKTYYYNLDDGAFIYPSGDRCNVVPELFYQETAVWRIALRDRRDLPVDISGVSAWGAAVDNNYCSGSAPMCRTLAEDIRADVESGAVEVTIDAATPEFLAAVNGTSVKPAFFELYGLDAAGERVLSLCFEIRARMVLDPDPTISGEIPEALATKVYAAALVNGAAADIRSELQPQIDARPTSSGARQIASAVITSGGYAKTSEVSGAVVGHDVSTAAHPELFARVVQVRNIMPDPKEAPFGQVICYTGEDDESTGYINGHTYQTVMSDDPDGEGFVPVWCDLTPGVPPGAAQLVTSTDSEMQPVISVLSGGTSYVFDSDHLYSIEVQSVVKTTEASYLHFTLDSVTAPTPVVISGFAFDSGRFEGGKEYLVGFFDGMAVVNEVTSGGVLQ